MGDNDQVNGEATKRDDKSMNELSFEEFFQRATGHAPYDYQCRLAGQGRGGVCESQLINIPTGLGKTAAALDGGLDADWRN